jgi:2-polyprenyl-3-methyl-5-hydroxy-6-metoxy-1,4-benzoquinol methylase
MARLCTAKARQGISKHSMATARLGYAWRSNGMARHGTAKAKHMENKELKEVYDKMHARGKEAWFDDGATEAHMICDMADWDSKAVLEIGCGEGDLLEWIFESGGDVVGIDYSDEAIATAKIKYPHLNFYNQPWEEFEIDGTDIIVMQGVLEHMDDWEQDLDSIISKYAPLTVITSMPCFINPRGIVWHTLDMLGAVMSKTDLHFINPWDMTDYCKERDYKLKWDTCEIDWGNGTKMIDDLKQRIPLALRDGDFFFNQDAVDRFIAWLDYTACLMPDALGAVNVYRVDMI